MTIPSVEDVEQLELSNTAGKLAVSISVSTLKISIAQRFHSQVCNTHKCSQIQAKHIYRNVQSSVILDNPKLVATRISLNNEVGNKSYIRCNGMLHCSEAE